jgi:hypothetical protein
MIRDSQHSAIRSGYADDFAGPVVGDMTGPVEVKVLARAGDRP